MNDLLDGLVEQAKQQLLKGFLGNDLPNIDLVENLAAHWGLRASREVAWTNAELLWQARVIPGLEDRFLSALIPIAKISYGMGAGGAETNSDMGGSGGGGGMRAVPVGVVEITPEGTRFIHFSGTKRMVGAVGLGFLAGYVIARFSRRLS